jgi:sulfur relay (sulfurtransferase) DsrC/TusE family protein
VTLLLRAAKPLARFISQPAGDPDMVRLKDTHRKVLEFMIKYFKEYQNMPFTTEICKATNLKRGAVLYAQRKLSELGYTDRFYVGKRVIVMILWKP